MNKSAIVSGAAGGIGQAVSRALAAAGYGLVICDAGVDPFGRGTDVERLEGLASDLEGTGVAIRSFSSSLNSGEAADAMVSAASSIAPLHMLVNCAGILDRVPFIESNHDDYLLMRRAHLDTTFFASRAAVRAMLPQRAGTIINFTSASAFAPTGGVFYSAMKGAVVGFTRTLAFELAPNGITVNALSPFADTRLPAASMQRDNNRHRESVRHLTASHPLPLPRLLPADSVARVVEALGTEKCRHVTGKVIGIAGTQLFIYAPSRARATVIRSEHDEAIGVIRRLVRGNTHP